MESNLILPPLFGIFGLAVAFILYLLVMRYDGGTDKVKKIGDQIHLGAMVFMRREYTYLAMFVAVLIVLSLFIFRSKYRISCYSRGIIIISCWMAWNVLCN